MPALMPQSFVGRLVESGRYTLQCCYPQARPHVASVAWRVCLLLKNRHALFAMHLLGMLEFVRVHNTNARTLSRPFVRMPQLD
jgi:hypothetical protein